MNLPPRLPPPTFAPDLADVTIVVAAARRRRARQSGFAGVALTAALAGLIAVNGGGTIRLSEQRPASSHSPFAPGTPHDAPTAPATERGTVAYAPGNTAPAGPATPHATETRGTPPATADAVYPLPEPGRRLAYDWAVVDDRPGVPCQVVLTGATTVTDPQGGDRRRCLRWWWAARTPYARGVAFVQETCVVDEMPEEASRYYSPGIRVHSYDYEFSAMEHSEHVELALAAHTCVRWTATWDGSGRPVDDDGNVVADAPPEFLPAGTYLVYVWWEGPMPGTAGPLPKSTGWNTGEGTQGQETVEVT
jgi:hypothetical protein